MDQKPKHYMPNALRAQWELRASVGFEKLQRRGNRRLSFMRIADQEKTRANRNLFFELANPLAREVF